MLKREADRLLAVEEGISKRLLADALGKLEDEIEEAKSSQSIHLQDLQKKAYLMRIKLSVLHESHNKRTLRCQMNNGHVWEHKERNKRECLHCRLLYE